MPAQRDLERLRAEPAGCRACPLWEKGTQTVFGEGNAGSRIMMVGEQPGDREDIEGQPFVGPAGRVLDQSLEEAGIDRATVYVTNTVKHFKWKPAGPRRLHQKPNAAEILACRPWLESEIETVSPELIVCLGATSAQALLGAKFRVTRDRGTFAPGPAGIWSTATVHPSSLLRAPDAATREIEIKRFVDDLRGVAEWIEKGPPAARG